MITLAIVGALLSTPLAQAQEDVQLQTPTGVLHGTLLTASTARTPVALIIAGSGPTDRDGNSPLLPGKNESLKLIAQELQKNGIASLRYDKRGIAKSMGAARSELELRFTTYVDDAAAWIEHLKSDARFTSVVVIGHSEGSLIGMMAARQAGAAKFISLAGGGRNIADVLEEQLNKNLPPEQKPTALAILSRLRQGQPADSVPPHLLMLFRKSVQPYLISLFAVDPAEQVKKFSGEVLLVQGTTDIQVTVADLKQLASALPSATAVTIEGMNHVLKEVREASQQVASYSDPSLPLHPELMPAIVKFIKQ